LIFWKTIVKRVTVVKLGVYDRGGTCFGGVKAKGMDEYSELHECDDGRMIVGHLAHRL